MVLVICVASRCGLLVRQAGKLFPDAPAAVAQRGGIMGSRQKKAETIGTQTGSAAVATPDGSAVPQETAAKPPSRRRKKTDVAERGSPVEEAADQPLPDNVPQPRLRKLKIKNLRCIGPNPVEIDLDRIVVLVGPNNAGKSTILFAYELMMHVGSNLGKLKETDFPNGRVDEENLPEIEIETVVHVLDAPGAQWIKVEDNGDHVVRERCTWIAPNANPKREGYDVTQSAWVSSVPWGAAGVAKSARPKPHRINAFDPPEEQAESVAKILLEVVLEQLKTAQAASQGTADGADVNISEYATLLASLAKLQKSVIVKARSQIEAAEKQLSSFVSEVFQGHEVKFDAREEDDLGKALSFFKAGAQLTMGATGEHFSPADRQGSGARRMLMWAALRYIAERKTDKADEASNRPHLLLLDEPELCLHPSAIRQACRVLYELSAQSNWQVMITTHSPIFIDLTQDNTTIVRVSRTESGAIQGTTIFRSDNHKLGPTERRELKLLNLCDPTVNEFFFGGRTIVVEGDTEYTAFKHVISESGRYRDVHIVRARGKVMVTLLAQILNHFKSDYAVLHDSDSPTVKVGGDEQANSAWKQNVHIRAQIKSARGMVRHAAIVPNFEAALFGHEVGSGKPYNALVKIREDRAVFDKVETLLKWLLGDPVGLPDWCVEFDDLATLNTHWHAWHVMSASFNGSAVSQVRQDEGGGKSSALVSCSKGQMGLFESLQAASAGSSASIK